MILEWFWAAVCVILSVVYSTLAAHAYLREDSKKEVRQTPSYILTANHFIPLYLVAVLPFWFAGNIVETQTFFPLREYFVSLLPQEGTTINLITSHIAAGLITFALPLYVIYLLGWEFEKMVYSEQK